MWVQFQHRKGAIQGGKSGPCLSCATAFQHHEGPIQRPARPQRRRCPVSTFNTTKVRFRGWLCRRPRGSCPTFNTTTVRFRGDPAATALRVSEALSTPQQSDLGDRAMARCTSVRICFQHHNGPIQRRARFQRARLCRMTFNTTAVRFRGFPT